MPLDLFIRYANLLHFIVENKWKEYAFYRHELRQHLIKCDGNVAVYNKTMCLNCKQQPEHFRIAIFKYLHVGVLYTTRMPCNFCPKSIKKNSATNIRELISMP